MLCWVDSMNRLPLEALEQIYSERLRQNIGRASYSCAVNDFFHYLRMDFFPQGGRYCVWEEKGEYVAAVRFLPFNDGLLLAGLETAPTHRRNGFATRLLTAALYELDGKESLPIYSHVHMNNKPSLKIHQDCGCRVAFDYAVLLDGTVSSRYSTLLRSL